jgi:predicted transcriptional regulator
MSKRSILRIELSPDAKEKLDQICKAQGMTQISVLSRLVSWFVNQDEVIQASVLGILSAESLQVLAKDLLEKLALPSK